MIPIQNIYYMLAYAFQALSANGYRELATESFENVQDLYAAILAKGISVQVKRGLGMEYVPKTEAKSSLRGRINITESLKAQTMLRRQMVCTYDEFTVNSERNQIIKSVLLLLLRSDIPKARKKELKHLLGYFADVDTVNLSLVRWDFQYNRNDQNYHLLLSICELVVKSLLQSSQGGSTKLIDFTDEQQMSRLYEKFILAHYRKEHPELHPCAAQIPWQLDDGNHAMLPVMQSDIMLTAGKRTLIIDAKYYGQMTQVQYGVHTLHSANLYQIFTYVKNKAAEMGTEHSVSGMLLYARTDEVIQPDNTYQMSGNQIAVRTLDLNCCFAEIRKQLEEIIGNWLQ